MSDVDLREGLPTLPNGLLFPGVGTPPRRVETWVGDNENPVTVTPLGPSVTPKVPTPTQGELIVWCVDRIRALEDRLDDRTLDKILVEHHEHPDIGRCAERIINLEKKVKSLESQIVRSMNSHLEVFHA